MKGGIGCGARGRGFAATPPGGPGSPSAPTTWGCLQWLDAAWTKGGESRLDAGVRARKHGPGGQKSRRWSAVWRTCLAKARQRREALDRWLRRTALHSLALGGGAKEDRPPRGLDK